MSISMKNAFAARVIAPLVAKLRARDDEQLLREVEELAEQNHLLGNPKQGFIFGGQFHTHLQAKSVNQLDRKLIHLTLKKAAQAYCNRKQTLETEMTRITNGLSLVLRPCESWQDVRDALPDVLRNEVDETSKLKRQRQEAWPLLDNPLQLHQYQQTAELLVFYYTNRLLF